MRKYLGLAVLAGALVAGAVRCGTGTRAAMAKRDAAARQRLDSARAAPVRASIFGNGGGLGIDPGNRQHRRRARRCRSGQPEHHPRHLRSRHCTDFPEAPIMGEGVPTNAPTLFGDPTNFTAGSLCVLEPQLSARRQARRDAARQLGPPALPRGRRPRRHRPAGDPHSFPGRSQRFGGLHQVLRGRRRRPVLVPAEGDLDRRPRRRTRRRIAPRARASPTTPPVSRVTVTIRGINSSAPASRSASRVTSTSRPSSPPAAWCSGP